MNTNSNNNKIRKDWEAVPNNQSNEPEDTDLLELSNDFDETEWKW